jgi:hypothetical protein
MRVKVFSFFITISIVIPFSSCAIEKDENTTLQGEIIDDGGSNIQNNNLEEVFIYSDWPGYKNLDELFNHATDVVRVEVLDDGIYRMVNTRLPNPKTLEWEPYFSLYTLYQVKVIESFRGNHSVGDTIIVGQRGGETDRIRLVSDAFIPFVSGDDLILFITIHEIIYHAELLTPWSAVYRIETENGTRVSSDTRASDDHKLVPVDERGHLSFTIGELRNYRTKEE